MAFWVLPWGGVDFVVLTPSSASSWVDTSVPWCVDIIYRNNIRANKDIWQRANPARLALLSPPLLLLLSWVLTTTAGSNQSVTSELCCNKSQPPPPSIFSLPRCFRSRPQQQKTTGLQKASPPPSLSGQRTAILAALLFGCLLLPRQTQMHIYLAHLCFCVINRWKLELWNWKMMMLFLRGNQSRVCFSDYMGSSPVFGAWWRRCWARLVEGGWEKKEQDCRMESECLLEQVRWPPTGLEFPFEVMCFLHSCHAPLLTPHWGSCAFLCAQDRTVQSGVESGSAHPVR